MNITNSTYNTTNFTFNTTSNYSDLYDHNRYFIIAIIILVITFVSYTIKCLLYNKKICF